MRLYGFKNAANAPKSKELIAPRNSRAPAMSKRTAADIRHSALKTPTSLSDNAVKDISAGVTAALADVFALYLKTKNFHWHISGPHFRDYHLLLDEQAAQLFAMTDDMAERVRKIGGNTLKSIGQISKLQRILDNDADFVAPDDMLAELRDDNKQLVESLRALHTLTDEAGDPATTSLIENWIDEGERRVWFLFETLRKG